MEVLFGLGGSQSVKGLFRAAELTAAVGWPSMQQGQVQACVGGVGRTKLDAIGLGRVARC